jgi:hypothetical protein
VACPQDVTVAVAVSPANKVAANTSTLLRNPGTRRRKPMGILVFLPLGARRVTPRLPFQRGLGIGLRVLHPFCPFSKKKRKSRKYRGVVIGWRSISSFESSSQRGHDCQRRCSPALTWPATELHCCVTRCGGSMGDLRESPAPAGGHRPRRSPHPGGHSRPARYASCGAEATA